MKLKGFLLICILSISTNNLFAQFSDWLSTVTAEVNASGEFIELKWAEETGTNFTVERKSVDESTWEVLSTNQAENFYVDEESTIGSAYEYRIFRNHSNGQKSYYFIYAGIEVPMSLKRGRILLVVESSVITALSEKVNRWIKDAEGDGWEVVMQTVESDDSVIDVKNMIRQVYNSEKSLRSVFLLGHVPVPYSGEIVPDGHTNHNGAWASDYYYADMNEPWTDYSVFVTEGLFESTKNIPGDGKFDQGLISDAELEVGRVDFHNLPIFNKTELELIEAYLDKNHAFKNGQFTDTNKGLVYNTFNQDFHANSDINIPSIVGLDNYEYENYYDNLTQDDYLWAYGAGGGSFTSAQGVINSQQYASDSLRAVFNILFGSYFGDFNSKDNLMRSALGSGTILTTMWSNPPWVLFHMGLGENIGLQARLTQSDLGIYNPTSSFGFFDNVHCSLLGDPTLRCHMIDPVKDLSVSKDNQEVTLSWSYPSADEGTLFYIYVKTQEESVFTLLEIQNYIELSYSYVESERCDVVEYMVRAQKLQSTPSGSYFNQSTGVSVEIALDFIDEDMDGYCAYEDCDDTDENVNLDQEEIIGNNIDDNCNGLIDEIDFDEDGFFDSEDCDDENAEISPISLEIPGNGIDENCDGLDDFLISCIEDVVGFQDDTTFAFQFINCDNLPIKIENEGIFPNSRYVLPIISNDGTININFCDGYDEEKWTGLISIYYYSMFSNVPEIGEHIKTESGCSINLKFVPDGMFYNGILIIFRDALNCENPKNMDANGFLEIKCIVDEDGDEYGALEDCDDTNPNVNPGQQEIAYNGLDDDCDETTLDDDLDQDGFLFADDCDDLNPDINPDAEEIPGNGIDENCDGEDRISSTENLPFNEIKIFPNPANDQFFVQIDSSDPLEIKIFNVNKNLVRKVKNSSMTRIDDLVPGLYFIEIVDTKTGYKVLKKLVVQ